MSLTGRLFDESALVTRSNSSNNATIQLQKYSYKFYIKNFTEGKEKYHQQTVFRLPNIKVHIGKRYETEDWKTVAEHKNHF